MNSNFQNKLRRTVMRAFLLPATTALLAGGVAALVMFDFVPRLEKTYNECGIPAPYATKVLIRASHLFDR